jgi:hypothetical protein
MLRLVPLLGHRDDLFLCRFVDHHIWRVEKLPHDRVVRLVCSRRHKAAGGLRTGCVVGTRAPILGGSRRGHSNRPAVRSSGRLAAGDRSRSRTGRLCVTCVAWQTVSWFASSVTIFDLRALSIQPSPSRYLASCSAGGGGMSCGTTTHSVVAAVFRSSQISCTPGSVQLRSRY